MNKLENGYSHEIMSSLRLISDEVLTFSIGTLFGSEKKIGMLYIFAQIINDLN